MKKSKCKYNKLVTEEVKLCGIFQNEDMKRLIVLQGKIDQGQF